MAHEVRQLFLPPGPVMIQIHSGRHQCGILGFNVWNAVHILGKGTILDFEDYIVSGFLLPLSPFIFLLFCVTGIGWGFDAYMKECNYGKGMKFSAKLKPYFQYVLPVSLLLVFLSGVL